MPHAENGAAGVRYPSTAGPRRSGGRGDGGRHRYRPDVEDAKRRRRRVGYIAFAVQGSTLAVQGYLAPGAHSHLVWLDVFHNGGDLLVPVLVWLTGWLGPKAEPWCQRVIALSLLTVGMLSGVRLIELALDGGTTGGSAQGAVAGVVGLVGNLATVLVFLSLGWGSRFARAAVWHALMDALMSTGPVVDRWAAEGGHAHLGLHIGALMGGFVIFVGGVLWATPSEAEEAR